MTNEVRTFRWSNLCRTCLVLTAVVVPLLLVGVMIWRGRPVRAESLSLPGPDSSYHYKTGQYNHWHDIMLRR